MIKTITINVILGLVVLLCMSAFLVVWVCKCLIVMILFLLVITVDYIIKAARK